METQENQLDEKTTLLKEARLRLLKIHKLLIDIERESYENENGKITSGHFLNLLLNDANFEWLRRFSTLIVEIDEMLDLDDGFTVDMIEIHLSQMRSLLDFQTEDNEFNLRYQQALRSHPEVLSLHNELKESEGVKE